MDKSTLTRQLQEAQYQLDKAEADQAEARAENDLHRLRSSRQAVQNAAADIQDIKALLAQYAAQEASAERVAARAAGREAAVKLTALAHETGVKAWARLSDQLQAAIATARELQQLGAESHQLMATALRGQHGADNMSALAALTALGPAVNGSTHAISLAVALKLRDLIDALPCALTLRSEYFLPNEMSMSVGRVAGYAEPLTLEQAALSAAEKVAVASRQLCVEPEGLAA